MPQSASLHGHQQLSRLAVALLLQLHAALTDCLYSCVKSSFLSVLCNVTQYHAGHSFARHGLAPPPPPMAPQPHMPYPPYPYAGHWEMPQAPLAAYSHYAAPAPYPSLPFNPMPWPGYGHYAAPRNSFAQSMPPTGRSFAQSMPPPGSLPFTMGSEPQAEAPRSSRQAQVAAAARTPARYRGRTPRTPPTRRRGGSSRSPRSPRSLAL